MEILSDRKDLFRSVRTMLAPMAGFSDSAFRCVCRSFGADATVSEMVSAKALRLGDKKSPLLMNFSDDERPFGIQLFGSDPDDIAWAASYAEKEFSPDFIDINMGCPAPKITGSGAGSKLMTDLPLAAEIASAAVSSVSLPVSCKIRAGYHETNADRLAPMLEAAGVSAIVVHGRTRDRMYAPPVDLDIIKRVSESVSIPVIGNGDITCASDAERMMEVTGCDGVMVGRGALGNPQVFLEIGAVLRGEPLPEPLTVSQRMDILMKQAEASVREKGEYLAMREMRKQCVYYFRGINGAAALRADCVTLETLDDLRSICERALSLGEARPQ